MISKISEKHNKLVIICGPTASGKSAASIDLAMSIGGEIINADSMQIYKEIPIITSSPNCEEKSKIKHYLYNFIPLGSKYSVAKFVEDASKAIMQIQQKGKIPILVGGTGMYINAMLNGLSNIPDVPENVREEGAKLLNELGNEKFYDHLCNIDNLASQKLHPSNTQRLLRAYEVITHTNKSIYEYHQEKTKSPLLGFDIKTLFINMDREKLYARCDVRLHHMIKDGVIEEVRKAKSIVDPSKVHAIGFKEFASFIDGEMSLYEALKKSQIKTRNYAKRQVTWFKNQLDNYQEFASSNLCQNAKLW